MAFNGSDIVYQPWNTTFSPYIHLLGQGWIVIPFAFIGLALFVKTRDIGLVGIYLIVFGGFMSVSTLAILPGASVFFIIMAGVGIGILMYNVFYGGR